MKAIAIDKKSQFDFVKEELDSFHDKSYALIESSRILSLSEGKELAIKLIDQWEKGSND